jgi:hypothetical protein
MGKRPVLSCIPVAETVEEHRFGPGAVLGRVSNVQSKLSWLGAILFSLFFLLTDIDIAHKRLLWYDEIGTVKLIQLPNFAALWQAQNSFRGDSVPTLYLLLARFFYQITGHSESAVRLLSAIAMAAALLVVFDCARRLTNGLHGLIALCILAGSFLAYYGYEGRPYSLVVLFTAIALWQWLHTRDDSKAAAAGFGAAIFLAVSMHFNAVLAMVPFGVWELYRWRPWRRPSLKFLAGAAGLLCALGICIPQMVTMYSIGRAPAGLWSAPSVGALVGVLRDVFPYGLFVLSVFAILVCLVRRAVKPMADSEAVCWLFLTIPIAGLILAEAVTNSFYNRYLIALLPGVAVAFACLVRRHLNTLGSTVLLSTLALLGVAWQLQTFLHPESIEPPSAGAPLQLRTRETLAAEADLILDGKRIVVAEFTLVQALRYYSQRPDLYVMYAGEADPYFCRYMGGACRHLDWARGDAKEVAAIYPSDYFLAVMSRAGFQATVKMTNPTVMYFSRR